jgi:hypothetical protein
MFEGRTAATDGTDRLFRGRRRAGRCGIRLAGAAAGMLFIASIAVAAHGAARPRTLATQGPVIALAADGDRAALVSGSRGVCATVVVWEPARRRAVRVRSATRSECAEGTPVTRAVGLAGTRVAWLTAGGRMTLETHIVTATLASRKAVSVGLALSTSGMGDFARNPAGDGTLLAFTVDRRCAEGEDADPQCPPGRRTGDVLAAAVWRVGGRGACPNSYSLVRRCSRVAKADGELSVIAVDAGRIAVRTETGVSLLTAAGKAVREFDVTARQAALSGNRLAVRTADAVEVYDTDSGQPAARFPAASNVRLEDLDGDILVTALGQTVTLRRLGDGRTTTIRAGGTAHAQLERPGLFVGGGRRVTFTPMSDVLRHLAD